MDLKVAIKLAVRFAERKAKDPTISQYVRFLPKAGDQPARLCSQNSRCGVIVRLDCDVPNTLVAAEFLEKVVKEAKYEVQIDSAAYGGVELKSGPATWWVRAEDIPQLEWFPEVPTVPLMFSAIDEVPISKVVHAALKNSKDLDRPALQTLHFVDGHVEATDKSRFARAPISGQWSGLLPIELFQKLPKGDLQAMFTLRLAYLRCEDEIRFAPYVALPFPDCNSLIPEIHEGPQAIVLVESLVRASKQALAVSDTGSITLRFEKSRLVVWAWRKDKEPKLFEALVGVEGGGDGQILVNGKNLVESLKVVKTPSVRLKYNQSMDPLRLESSGYTEVLWPMLA